MARHPGAAAIAAIVTFGLFYVMHALSSIRDVARPVGPEFPPILIAEVPEESEVRPKPRTPVKPVDGSTLKPPPFLEASLTAPEGGKVIAGPVTPVKLPFDPQGTTDSPVIRMFCPSPVYPPGPARRRIGGWVRVSFDVSRAGATENVHIVDSDPPHVFDSAAVGAAERCRFQARKQAGEAVRTRDVPLLFSFDPTEQEETR